MKVLIESLSENLADLERGYLGSGFSDAVRELGAKMVRASFLNRLDGKVVLLAVRPEDADDFGKGVQAELAKLGATVRIACLWTDKDYRPSEDAPPKYIVRTEYVQPLAVPPHLVVLAIPVLVSLDLANAMWQSISGRAGEAELSLLCAVASGYHHFVFHEGVQPLAARLDRCSIAALTHNRRMKQRLFRKSHDGRSDLQGEDIPRMVQNLFYEALAEKRLATPSP